MFQHSVPVRARTKIFYKLFTAVVLLLCSLHLFYLSSYFETDPQEKYYASHVDGKEDISSDISDKFRYHNNDRKIPSNEKKDISDFDMPVQWSLMTSTMVTTLLDHLSRDWHFWWISSRIQSLWPEFEGAGMMLHGQCKESSTPKKKILFLPGVLKLTNFASPSVIKRGGSLGELTQWADLIAGCLALCHYIDIKINFKMADAHLRAVASKKNSGQGCASSDVDLIFTDIGGFRSLSPDVVKLYKNKFRIVDVYGTEAAYNDPEFATANNLSINRWGMLDLHLKQFYTMFPHTPDNSFLGFVISSRSLITTHSKENFTLILGKEIQYIRGKDALLNTIHKYFPLVATLPSQATNLFPEGSVLLGIVDSLNYVDLLSNAKVCLGVGDPIESPSPLLAIAAGCVFLNPKKNQTLTGKPTSRIVTSQNQYLEQYFGPPNVYTYDPNNMTELEKMLAQIKKIKEVQPFIPKAFTANGYLKRLNGYLLNQTFCNGSNPPLGDKLFKAFMAADSESCKGVCYQKGMICEPDFFARINSASFFNSSGLKCKLIKLIRHPSSPSYNVQKRTCFLQPPSNPLFSCAGQSMAGGGNFRLCGCRSDEYGQISTKKVKKLKKKKPKKLYRALNNKANKSYKNKLFINRLLVDME